MNKNSQSISKNQNLHDRIAFFINNLSSKNQKLKEQENNNIYQNKKSNSKNAIPIQKEIGKMAEPRFKISSFEKLLPKFYKSIDMSSSFVSHEITTSEIEMLEIDEKLPQKKLDQIESKRFNYIINNTFPFHFLIEIEKCYQEISKDLKGNGNKNLDYKIKIAASYLNIIMNEENIIFNYFLYNKEANKFFLRELCTFLCILFLNDFSIIKENDIADLNNCITYSHLNFLFITMILVNKTNENIYLIDSNIDNNNKKMINNYYLYFQKCKTIIELNNDKIDEIKLKNNFNCHNKIIKNI